MTGSTRRIRATVAAAAMLALGLSACGQGGDQEGSSVTVGSRPTSTPAPPEPAPETSTVPPAVAPVPTSPATTTPAVTPSSPPTVAPTPTKTTPAPTKPKPAPTKPAPTKPVPARDDIRMGDRGPKVLAVQQRLSALGYWLGEPDGHYGSLTRQAVWALQKSAGLSRDGNVGPATQKALANGVRPSTNLSGNGIDINLKRQILMIVRGGEVKYILNTSTGGGYEYETKKGNTATARTPKGTFKVWYTVDGSDEGFLGTMWRPRYFHGGYAVHGSPSIPAYAASHGCARVSNSAMNMIWARDFMPKGSTVLVR